MAPEKFAVFSHLSAFVAALNSRLLSGVARTILPAKQGTTERTVSENVTILT
jgi:hypothetical protein